MADINVLYLKIYKILRHTILAGIEKIGKIQNTFEILGCDIMIDNNFKPYLIELNSTPAYACDTKT